MGEGENSYFTNYPKHVFLILANEFCERFSYYGMKAFLVLYLTDALNFDDNTATSIYHSFVVLCYFTPLLGAMIADGWLGKFKTILYISLVYILGSIIMTVTAIPFDGSYVVWAPFIGLVLIAFGTGGIKPNVSAFGGDQFSPEQSRQKTSFFSLFYMSINIGSLLSTIITPLIRGYVYCFDDNCYSLAFGIPAILMIVSEIVFVIGSKWYTKIPPGESILRNMFGCIGTAIGRKCHCCCSKGARDEDFLSEGEEETKTMTKKKHHWLDYAAPDYNDQFISDVKDVLRVAWVFLPLPIFWALYDQQGSRWTLQATQMNGDVGGFIVLPDMIQVLNPLFVVILVPLFESLIYPCLDKLHIPNRALQRMGVGMIFAGTAFLLAGFLQMAIDQDFPPGIPSGQVKFQFVNPSSCQVNVKYIHADQDYNIESFKSTPYMNVNAGNYTFEVTWTEECVGLNSSYVNNYTRMLDENKAYQLFTDESDYNIHEFHQEKTEPTGGSQSTVRFYNALDQGVNLSMTTTNRNQEKTPRQLGIVHKQNVSPYEEIILSNFKVNVKLPFKVGNEDNETVYNISKDLSNEIYSENGAVYVVLIHYENSSNKDAITHTQIMEIPPWTTSIFLQVPQYFLMTTGEVLFSVTGLSFAYSQAAPSMKSILTAIWLMTIAIGNVVVVIVAETGSAMSQMAEFFLFSGLMYVTTVIFAIMTLFYTYVDRNDWGRQTTETKLTIGEDNEGLEMHAEKVKIDRDDSDKEEELSEKKENLENEYELPQEDEDIKL